MPCKMLSLLFGVSWRWVLMQGIIYYIINNWYSNEAYRDGASIYAIGVAADGPSEGDQ